MAFVPKYDAKGIGPILDNLEALLAEKEADALLWANDGQPLPATKKWRRSFWFNTKFPVVSIVGEKSDPQESEDNSHIRQEHSITLNVEIDGPDPDENTRLVQRRLKAYDMILRGATKAEVLKGFEASKAGANWMEIGPHDYSYFGNREQQMYVTSASLTITVRLIELRHRTQ